MEMSTFYHLFSEQSQTVETFMLVMFSAGAVLGSVYMILPRLMPAEILTYYDRIYTWMVYVIFIVLMGGAIWTKY